MKMKRLARKAIVLCALFLTSLYGYAQSTVYLISSNDQTAPSMHVQVNGGVDGMIEMVSPFHKATNIKNTNTDNSVDISDLDGYRNYDFGVIGDVGFWFGHFNVELGYQRGFVSIFEGDNKFFCDKLQVRLGYAF